MNYTYHVILTDEDALHRLFTSRWEANIVVVEAHMDMVLSHEVPQLDEYKGVGIPVYLMYDMNGAIARVVVCGEKHRMCIMGDRLIAFAARTVEQK